MKKFTFLIVFMLLFLGTAKLYSQTTYYSAASATDFNNVASWGTATDGTGTAPASISNADNFVIANNAALSLSASATVRQLTINSGSLSVTSNALTVSKAGTFDSALAVNSGGTLTQSGGNIIVNGNVLIASGGNLTQSGGEITVDGNNGGSTTGSVASGTSLFSIGSSTAYSSGTVSLTGGKIIIVDPHAAAGSSNYAFNANLSSTAMNITATIGHTLQIGDGVSTDTSANTNGYHVYFWAGTGAFKAGNFVINAPVGTNRFVFQQYRSIFAGNVTVTKGELQFSSTGPHIVGGNVFVDTDGILTTGSALYLGNAEYTGSTSFNATPATIAQTVSGPGIFRSAAISANANFSGVTVNNSSATGVTFSALNAITGQPANSISTNTLTFAGGKITTAGNAVFVLGNSSPSAGTLNYTAGGFVSGTTFGRWSTAAGTGTSFTAGSDATSATSRYPFVNAAGQDRSAWIERVTPTSAAGILGVTYTNTAGTTAVNAIDASVTPNFQVDTKANDGWQVAALSGTPLSAASFRFQIQAPGIFAAQQVVANTRVIQGNAFVGTHQAGTITPGGQRVGLTGAELTAAPFTLAISSSDLPVTSVASGDWNNPATWSSGVVPTCDTPISIVAGHTITVNSAGNVAKTVIINSGATLTVASGNITIGCTLNNATLNNSGTLNITGGTITLNGNYNMNNGASLTQTGGDFTIDGNDNGATATSVASGTPIFRIGNSTTAYSTGTINLTGGTITIVDPHTASSNSSGYAVYVYFPSGFNVEAGAGHTFKFGDGVSTQAGGHTSGFYIDTYVSSGRLNPGNIIVNNPSGTNRIVTTPFGTGVHGNVSVLAGDFRPSALTLQGNLSVTGGSYIATGGLTLAAPLGTGSAVNTAAQSIGYTAPGVVKNAVTAETANLTSFTINNSSTDGVTLNSPFSQSGTLTLTAGKVNTTAANLLTVGTATAAATITGGSITAYINGPLARTVATGNAATNYIAFPVGKATYAPVSIAPTTTAVSVFKAEAFDANTGTADASIINLATGRRWEVPVVSGTFTDIKVRVGDTAIVTGNIPVTAPTAAGAYSSTFGSTATFTAGTSGAPNVIQSDNAVSAANYTGFISYAVSNLCSGTPAPGNTLATSTSICSGQSITLSVQNITTGSGVTYQWQSSADNTTYTNIDGATSATYVTTPTTALYYRLNVTCSAGPATGTSTPVQVNFANSITGTTPASRCGAGPITLSATGSAGTLNWYASPTSNTVLATGASFTTNVTGTTTYYVSTSVGGASAMVGPVSPTAQGGTIGDQTVDWNVNFTVLQSTVLNSVDVFPVTSGQAATIFVRNSSGTVLATYNYTTSVSGGTTAQTVQLGYALTPGNYQLYTTLPASGLKRNTSGATYPYTSSLANITGNGYDNTYFMGLYNWNFGTSCASPRVPVTATVNPAPALTVSGNPAAICAGQTTAAVTLTAGASDYDTFTWTPSTGVSGSAGAGWTFNPSVSTVYTLNASSSTGAMCVANAATVSVTVNPLPTAIVAPATVAVCEGGIAQITTTGGVASAIVFQDNFDVLSTQFSTASTAGTPTATLNSTYYAQGTGAALFGTSSQNADVNYAVNSNINLTGYNSAQLTFSHIAAMEGPTNSWDLGYVQYSADGGATWTTFPSSSYAGNGTLVTMQGTDVPISGVVFSAKSYPDWTNQFTGTTATPGTGPATSLWKNETINIPAAALTSQFRVRFRYTSDVSALYYGWLIDNLKVTGSNNRVVWSPATNLYTDAAATQAYVAGTVAPTVYVAAPATATTYTASATNTATGCGVSATVNVTVTSTPAPTAAATQTFCNAATVANLVATGTTIQWYAAATGGTALAGTTALANGTTYYASQTVNGCQSVLRTPVAVTINVTAAPTASAQTFCNAATVADLTATGTGIQWYAAATGGTALAGTTALATGSYYASQTVNGCESTRTEVAVTVNVTAAPTASAQTFCNAATVADLTATGTGIQWYSAATGGSALTGTTALATGSYYASQTVNGCESATRTEVAVTVNVTAAPTASAQTFCNAATVADLTATGTGIQWYSAAIGGAALAGTTALATGSYYASQTVNGCESATRTEVAVTVTVTAAPTASAQTFCNAATVADLTATGTGIQWYSAATGGSALTGTTALATGSYYASQTVNGCESATRTEVAVTVNVTAGVEGETTQVINANVAADATIEDIVVTATGTVTWYASLEDAQQGEDALAAGTQLTNNTTYYAVQTVDGCTSADVLAVLVTVVLSREDFDTTAFAYYPNPVKDVITISYNKEITSVSVVNLLGQEVAKATPNATEARIDMTGLAEGSYMITVRSDNAVKTVKVIKAGR